MATSSTPLEGSPVVIPPDLKEVLPTNYEYKVEKFTSIEAYSEEPRFTAEFRTTVTTKVEALRWLSEFTDISLSTWRVRNNYPEDTDRIVYKIRYRCHHNTLPNLRQVAKPHEKHVRCPAKLHITIQKPLKYSKIRGSVKSFPCLITLENIHNHVIHSVNSLRHRDPSNAVREKFITLFSCHFPSSALEVHLRDLQLEHGDNYFSVSQDRFICPDASWVYRLFYKTFQNSVQRGVSSDNCHLESIDNEFPLPVPEQMHTAEVSHEEDGGISSGKIDEIRGKLNAITTDLMTKVESQPEYFYSAISKFAHNYWSCQTDAAKVSALTTFGHYTGGGKVASSEGRVVL